MLNITTNPIKIGDLVKIVPNHNNSCIYSCVFNEFGYIVEFFSSNQCKNVGIIVDIFYAQVNTLFYKVLINNKIINMREDYQQFEVIS